MACVPHLLCPHGARHLLRRSTHPEEHRRRARDVSHTSGSAIFLGSFSRPREAGGARTSPRRVSKVATMLMLALTKVDLRVHRRSAEAEVGQSAAATLSAAEIRSCMRGRDGVAAARGVRGMREALGGPRETSLHHQLCLGSQRRRSLGRAIISSRQRCGCLQAARAYKKDFLRSKKKQKEAKVLALRMQKKQKCSL